MKDHQGTVGKKNSTTSSSVENDSWKLFTRVPWDKSLLPPISRNFVPSLPAAFFLSIPIHGLFSSCLELWKSICSSGFNSLIHEKTKTGEKTTHASCFQCSPPARITLGEAMLTLLEHMPKSPGIRILRQEEPSGSCYIQKQSLKTKNQKSEATLSYMRPFLKTRA